MSDPNTFTIADNSFTFNPVEDYWLTHSWSDDISLAERAEELGAYVRCPTDDNIGNACKWLSKRAWQIRKIEARRFCVPAMQISWRRSLYLAALSLKHRWNNGLVQALLNDAARGKGCLIWS